MPQSKVENFIKLCAHKEKKSGLVQSQTLPQPTNLSSVGSPVSWILSTHKHIQDCLWGPFL